MGTFGQAILTALSQTGLQGAQSAYLENSMCIITASYLDTTGAPFLPSAVRYRVTDLVSGSILIPWTPVTPALTNQITITSAQNALVSWSRPSETHEVLVEITDANGNRFDASVRFDLLRTTGAPLIDENLGVAMMLESRDIVIGHL